MNIIICGGGTAGWLAALMIKKIQGNSHDITVIESSKIGIIGAGEGSTGYLTDIIQNNRWDFGCNEEDFIKETGATPKLGIKHKDWSAKGVTYYGPIDGTDAGGSGPDMFLLNRLMSGLPAHTASQNGQLIERKLSGFFREHNNDYNSNNLKSHAYHFDAHKVGQYFKKIVSLDGVKTIDAEIVEVNLNDYGVTSVLLSNGTTVAGDFFIDCTGFARMLAKKVGMSWVSFKEHLPVNTAMPFLKKYRPNEEIEPVTTAWAQSSGWMWQIPTQERYGCGYVFDDNFITHEQAQLEIEQALGHEIEPIRFLKFDTGRLDNVWNKNCLALGLCAAFAEPLEATSIHSTIIQLTSFIFDYLRDTKEETINLGSQKIYNRKTAEMYDNFKDFLVLHYQTKRNDSEFWRWMSTGETRTETVNSIIELTRTKIPQGNDFTAGYGLAGASLWNWILCGLGYIDQNLAKKEFEFWKVDKDMAAIRWSMFNNTMDHYESLMMSTTEFVGRYK
jgi:tryptophan halogenase